MWPNLRTISDVLRWHAGTRPGAMAMLCEGRATTFAELDRRANQVARGLLESRQAGSRAAILDTNSSVFFELLFGAARANQIVVPINSRLSRAEMADILNDAQPDLLFVGDEFLDVAETLHSACPSIRQVLTLGTDRSPWAGYRSWVERQSPIDPALPVDDSETALVMYTSGTTGHARGAQLTHRNLLTNAVLLVQEYGSVPGQDVGLICLPLFHVGGCLWALSCLYAGVSIVILRRVTATEVLEAIAEHRVTKALFVPTIIQLLLDAPDREQYDTSSLDLVLYGASPIAPDLLRRAIAAFKCHFGQVYGLTETAGAISYLTPADHDVNHPARLLSCGKPLSHAEIRVVDRLGRDMPVGQTGEIICRTPQNMKGYWNRPAETAAIVRDGWLYTGDAGHFDTDGYLYIQDRIKDLIISGGENIYPAEVERVLSAHPDVADVAVIGVPDDRWGEAVKALVVRRPGASVPAEELIAFCRPNIAGYKLPKSIDFVESLMRNAAGKLVRHEIRAPYWSRRSRPV